MNDDYSEFLCVQNAFLSIICKMLELDRYRIDIVVQGYKILTLFDRISGMRLVNIPFMVH